MSIDLKKSFSNVVVEKPIATGYTIATEGSLLMRVVEGGIEKVKPTTGAGGEVIVGFSMANNEQPGTMTNVESVTCEATLQLAHTNILGAIATTSVEISVYDNVELGWITQVNDTTPNDKTLFYIVPATGVCTFHADAVGHSLTISYRYYLTVVESQQLFFQPNVNNTSINVLGLVGVYTGKGQIYTMEYDISKDYSVAAPALTTMPVVGVNAQNAGKITISGGGATSLTSFMRVIKAPTASDMSLGLEFNL